MLFCVQNNIFCTTYLYGIHWENVRGVCKLSSTTVNILHKRNIETFLLLCGILKTVLVLGLKTGGVLKLACLLMVVSSLWLRGSLDIYSRGGGGALNSWKVLWLSQIHELNQFKPITFIKVCSCTTQAPCLIMMTESSLSPFGPICA